MCGGFRINFSTGRTTSTTIRPQSVTNATTINTEFMTCNWNEFACRNGRQCVPKSAKCNNKYECQDNSDEDNCCKFTTYSREYDHLFT